jgi:menaquinone-specific isochorismate synthase
MDATRRIRRGELEKVVLAQACRTRAAQALEPTDVLARLAHSYPDCCRFLIEPIPGHAFYGATPELLAEVEGATVHTVALAGSIRRGSSPKEDATLGQELLNSAKDHREHALVVEAIQEHLLPLVAKLHVPGRPGLLKLRNIQHLQTVIRGDLAQACGVLPVVEALHPTPAVGGTPRDVALRLIQAAEPFPRGWYASPVGWIDAQGNGRFAVALRSAVSVEDETWLYAGAGIVADSDPEREWEEVLLKFRPILEALEIRD